MCGIVCVAGESTKQNDNVLETLLILDQLRGIDSTGVAVIPRGDFDVNIAKEVGNAFDLMSTKGFFNAMNCATRAIIGHNRSATSGTIIQENAHPFENDSIVGVHNGTLTSKWRLLDQALFKVDSENLYHHMDKKGLKDTLDNLQGAWSLVWWDKLDETLNFLRNDQRPMFKAWSLDHKSLYAASESWMLSVALARHGVKHTEITSTEVDQHYSYHISKEGAISKPRMSAAPSTYRGYVTQSCQGKWYGNNNVQQTQQTQASSSQSVAKKSVVDNRYEGRFDTQIEVIAKTKDCFGGEYYVCLDALYPGHSIRLYINRKDEADLTGKMITCNIAPVSYIEGSRSYYKVSASTVTVVPEPQGEEYFTDHKGNKLKADIWHLRYGYCAACSGVVNPRFAFRFVANTPEAICHECAADEAVQQMIAMY